MTTGTQIVDSRGYGGAGLYSVKSWTGTDYPPTKPTFTNVSYIGKKGQRYTRKVWVKKPRRFYVVDHPYSMSLTVRNMTLFTAAYYPYMIGTQTPFVAFGNNVYGAYLNMSLFDANDDLAFLSKLREKVAGSDFNAGVFLGEGHQVLRMIGDSALKIAKSLRCLKKGNLRGASVALTGRATDPKTGKVANNWLELQYGWLPLLSDAYGGALFLAHHLNTPLQTTIRVARSKKMTTWNDQPPGSSMPDSSWIHDCGSIKAILKEKDVAQLAGLTDPLSVAWELVPYSFVVDWFIPIGSWLSARGLASALTGTFVTTRMTTTAGNGWGDTMPGRLFVARGSWAKKIVLSRTISTTLSVPTPKIKPLEKVVSWQHAANAVALLTQRHGTSASVTANGPQDLRRIDSAELSRVF